MSRSFLTIAAAIVAMSALSFSGWVFFTPLKATAAAHSSAMSHEKENLDAYLILYDTYRDAVYPPKEAAEVALYVLLRAVGHDVETPSLDHIDWPEGHEFLSPQSSGVALLVEPYLAQEMPDEQIISIVYGMLHEASILTGGAFYLEEEPFDAPQCEARRLRRRFCDEN